MYDFIQDPCIQNIYTVLSALHIKLDSPVVRLSQISCTVQVALLKTETLWNQRIICGQIWWIPSKFQHGERTYDFPQVQWRGGRKWCPRHYCSLESALYWWSDFAGMSQTLVVYILKLATWYKHPRKLQFISLSVSFYFCN